jgi:hypothetical protein
MMPAASLPDPRASKARPGDLVQQTWMAGMSPAMTR